MALRLYCPQLELGCVPLPESEARHASGSRRLRSGDPVILFDGRGSYAHAELCTPAVVQRSSRLAGGVKARRAAALAAMVTAVDRVPPPAAALTLIVAGCKGARLDWLVEKSTELGVTRLVLAEFERSVVHVSASHVTGLERTAIEACKQCGRLWLPEISAGLPLSAALSEYSPAQADIADHGQSGDVSRRPPSAAAAGCARSAEPVKCPARALAFADPAATQPLSEWLRSHASAAAAVIIGPEGGLTPAEISAASEAGAQPVRLAEHVLRVETAALAAAAAWAASMPVTSR